MKLLEVPCAVVVAVRCLLASAEHVGKAVIELLSWNILQSIIFFIVKR
jgi:hypothetical protein